MTQPVKAPFKNRGARRLAWLFSLWAVTALMLSAIWPVRPRLILSNGEGSLIVGITPDNRWLVTLSQRAMAIPREADASADDDQNYESFWSGPIQVWNLHSGEVRHIGLPSQSDDGPIDSTNGFNELGRVDPDAWRVDIPLEPFRDGPFHLVQTNRVGERWSVEIDLNSGSAKRVRMPDVAKRLEQEDFLSRSGRWCVDTNYVEDGKHTLATVIDTKSGFVHATFDLAGYAIGHCFSADENFLALSAENEANGITQICQLEPPQMLRVIDRGGNSMAFSPDKKWIAIGSMFRGIAIHEIETGRTVHDFPIKGVLQGNPAFTADGVHMAAGFDIPFPTLDIQPFGKRYWPIREIHVWNLQTGGHLSHLSRQNSDFFDISLSDRDWVDRIPSIVADDNRLVDMPTGRTIFTIPKGTKVEKISPSGHTIVLERLVRNNNDLLRSLQQKNVPIPNSLWQSQIRELIVCDALSGQIRGCVSPDGGSPEHIAFSSDERTLVMSSPFNPPTFSVWDFPLRKPLLRPVAWSLLVPLCFLLWPLWKRCWAALFSWRRRSSPTSTATGAADDVAR